MKQTSPARRKSTATKRVPWKAIAESVGVSAKTLERYRKLPDFPSTANVTSVMKWLALRVTDDGQGKDEGDLGIQAVYRRKKIADMRYAEMRASLAEIEKRFRSDELVERQAINEKIGRIAAALKNEMLDLPRVIRAECITMISNPDDAGKIEALIDTRLRLAMHKAIDEMSA